MSVVRIMWPLVCVVDCLPATWSPDCLKGRGLSAIKSVAHRKLRLPTARRADSAAVLSERRCQLITAPVLQALFRTGPSSLMSGQGTSSSCVHHRKYPVLKTTIGGWSRCSAVKAEPETQTSTRCFKLQMSMTVQSGGVNADEVIHILHSIDGLFD